MHVRSNLELVAAVKTAKPGTTILIASGSYVGGVSVQNLHGEAGRVITIAGADAKNPPVFCGGNTGMQFSQVSYLELSDIVILGAQFNGLNIDDGGTITKPTHHVTLRNIRVSDLPKGNHDGIKLSGIDDFRVVNCELSRWGGSGIDMVGCHRGVIVDCRFSDGGDSGIQAKGGSSEIKIQGSQFLRGGLRGVNIGGSTGEAYFRPALSAMGAEKYETRNITVEGCTFVEGGAPVAFVGVDGAAVRFNTFYKPGRWVLRILQETQLPGFVASRNGVFEDNLVVFESKNWAAGGVNIGSGAAPETFGFARNFWYCLDAPGRSQPSLPVAEKGGVYGVDPEVTVDEKGVVSVKKGSSAEQVGAHAWKVLE